MTWLQWVLLVAAIGAGSVPVVSYRRGQRGLPEWARRGRKR